MNTCAEKDSSDSAVVDRGYHWLPVDENAPRAKKVQLIHRPSGVATTGYLTSGNNWWTHWAPLPTFRD